MTDASDGKRDFFVSFNKADRAWATWIAWVLEEAGYSVFFQDWDFRGNFVLEMDKAHSWSRRTIAVLSPDYPAASRYSATKGCVALALPHLRNLSGAAGPGDVLVTDGLVIPARSENGKMITELPL